MVYYLVEFPINWKKYKYSGLLDDAPDAEWAPMMRLLPSPWMGGRPLTSHEKELFKLHGCDTVPWEFPSKEAAISKAIGGIKFEERHKTGILPVRVVKVSQGTRHIVWFDPRPEAREKVGELGGLYS